MKTVGSPNLTSKPKIPISKSMLIYSENLSVQNNELKTDEGDSYSYLNYDPEIWDINRRKKKIGNRLISILAFMIIFAMCFVIMYTLRMSDEIDEKGELKSYKLTRGDF